MRTRHLALAAIVVLVGLGSPSSAQGPQAPQPPVVLTAKDGVQLMRMILTMQANRPYGPREGYGTLADILPLMPEVRAEATMIDDQTASLHGYTIRLTRSADRKRFDLTLARDGSCADAWFSNDRNVIYAGRPIGCPAQ